MGLQISHTDKEGETYPESYWVVSNVKIEKKFHDSGQMPIANEFIADWVKYAGTYGIISIMGWKTKADRDAGKEPRYIMSVFPTGWTPPSGYHEYTGSEDLRFTVDLNDPLFEQAYVHLKTVDKFSNAEDV